MPGGVAGVQPIMAAPYADPLWPVQPGECVVLVVRTMDSKVGGGKMAFLPAQLQTPT
jgi:hypothetical protein